MSARPPLRQAAGDDLSRLVELMAAFYAESGYVLERQRAARAFDALLSDPRLGRVWLIEHDGNVVGYVVTTFVFAMEYGGPTAVADDFFIEPASRDAGLGTAALAEVRRICAGLGMRALRVEVGGDNAVAQAVYRSAGFEAVDHQLMTVRLADPTHVE
jgi:GNAT superfamily N-acetyltransferase